MILHAQIKPLEAKLKYQIDKLVRASKLAEDNVGAGPSEGGQDPLSHKPKLALDDGSSGDDEEEDAKMKAKTKRRPQAQPAEEEDVYRPPRIAPVYFDDEKATRDPLGSTSKLSARTKDRASRSRVIRDLVKEYDDRPEQVNAEGTGLDWADVEASGFAKDARKLRERDESVSPLFSFFETLNKCLHLPHKQIRRDQLHPSPYYSRGQADAKFVTDRSNDGP